MNFSWWRRSRAPIDLGTAFGRIRSCDVAMRPYPHIVVRDALPPSTFDHIKAKWPDRSRMFHEAAHDRHFSYFQQSNSCWHSDPDWRAIKTDVVDPMFAAIADRLRPYFSARYSGEIELEPKLLALHEAGAAFTEHKSHSHFEHNPRYAFTVLYCVDDDGFAGRGTTLYGFRDLPVTLDGVGDDALMHRVSGQLLYFMRPEVVVPFEPNRLLAFVDGPMSVHGSTPFDQALNLTGTRRMILSHVTDRAAELEVAPADCVDQFRRYREGGAPIEPWMRELLARERSVIASWSTNHE